MQGLVFGVQGLGFRVQGSGLGVQGLGSWVRGAGSRHHHPRECPPNGSLSLMWRVMGST